MPKLPKIQDGKVVISLRGWRLKGKGKGVLGKGVLGVSLAPKTPFPKAPFPFPFKRLPRRLSRNGRLLANRARFGDN